MNPTVAVTGASRGIGRAVAHALAARGAHVVLLCRDRARGEAVRGEIEAQHPKRASLVLGALDSLAQIRATASALARACPRIDVLVHNAGVWPAQRVLTEDGLEQAFVVNHLAPFLLNHLLAPQLIASRARIVQVSAGLYVKGHVDLARTPTGDDFSALGTYANTKLCNLALLPRASADFAPHGVTVNAVHPGVIRTDLGDRSGALGALLRVVKRFWKDPAEGARPIVRLALDPALEGVTGRYYDVDVEVPLRPVARDEALAAALFRQAAELCGVAPLHSAPIDGEAVTQ